MCVCGLNSAISSGILWLLIKPAHNTNYNADKWWAGGWGGDDLVSGESLCAWVCFYTGRMQKRQRETEANAHADPHTLHDLNKRLKSGFVSGEMWARLRCISMHRHRNSRRVWTNRSCKKPISAPTGMIAHDFPAAHRLKPDVWSERRWRVNNKKSNRQTRKETPEHCENSGPGTANFGSHAAATTFVMHIHKLVLLRSRIYACNMETF